MSNITASTLTSTFVFSGSKRHMMAMMFTAQARPFHHSSSIMGLEAIDEATYLAFANHHLGKNGKEISGEAFSYLYQQYDGITWYIQYVLNMLYTASTNQGVIGIEDVKAVIRIILSQQRFAYQALLYQLTSKQKQVLTAIAQEEKPSSLMSQDFLQKYRLGASTVQGVIKVLLDRDFITQDEGYFSLCDKFLEQSLNEKE